MGIGLIKAVEPRRSECTLGIFSKFRHDCSTAAEPSLASCWSSYETTCRRFEYSTSAITVSSLMCFMEFVTNEPLGISSVMTLLPSRPTLNPSSRPTRPTPLETSSTIGVPGYPRIQRTSFFNRRVEDALFHRRAKNRSQVLKKRLGMYLTRYRRLVGRPFVQNGYLRISPQSWKSFRSGTSWRRLCWKSKGILQITR